MTQAQQLLKRIRVGDKVSNQVKFNAIKVQLPTITPEMVLKLGGYDIILDAIQYGPRDLETLYMMYEIGFRSKKRIQTLTRQLIRRNKLTVSGVDFDDAFRMTLTTQIIHQLEDGLTESQIRQDLSAQTLYRVFYIRPELWAMTIDLGYPDDDDYLIVYEMKTSKDRLGQMVTAAIEVAIDEVTS